MKAQSIEVGDPEIRMRIISTALRLFHSHGYNAIGVSEFIKEANVAKRTFYKYFASKRAVLEAYLDTYDDNLYVIVEQHLSQFEDPKQKILALFDLRAGNQMKNNYLGCPFVKINNEIGYDDADINLLVKKSKIRFMAYLRGLAASANVRQILSDEELADMIFLLLDGGLIAATIFKSNQEIINAKKLVERFL